MPVLKPRPERFSDEKIAAIKRALSRYSYGDDRGEIYPVLADALAEKQLAYRVPAVVSALAVSRVLIPVFPHEVKSAEADSNTPCAEGELFGKELHIGGAHLRVAECFSDAKRLLETYPEARPVPVSARSFSAMAYSNPGRALLDGEIFLSRTALAAIATADIWLPTWENQKLVAEIREMARAFPGLEVLGIRPQEAAPDALLVRITGDFPTAQKSVIALQQSVSKLPTLAESADVLVVTPFM